MVDPKVIGVILSFSRLSVFRLAIRPFRQQGSEKGDIARFFHVHGKEIWEGGKALQLADVRKPDINFAFIVPFLYIFRQDINQLVDTPLAVKSFQQLSIVELSSLGASSLVEHEVAGQHLIEVQTQDDRG